jgi:hypothetical protein
VFVCTVLSIEEPEQYLWHVGSAGGWELKIGAQNEFAVKILDVLYGFIRGIYHGH